MLARQTDPALVSLHRTARKLGLAPRRLRAAVRQGALPGFQPGNRTIYLRWPDVEKWVESQRVPISDHAQKCVADRLEHEAKMGG